MSYCTRIALVALLPAALACSRKTPPALAEAELTDRLPPDALVYVQADLLRLGGDGAGRDRLLDLVPSACFEAARRAGRGALAVYGTDRFGVVALVEGPSDADVEGCLETVGELTVGPPEGEPPLRPVSNGDGRLLWLGRPTAELLLIASDGMQDLVRATLAGGPSLSGGPLPALLGEVPAAQVAMAVRPDGRMAKQAAEFLADLAGSEAPLPEGLAVSFSLGEGFSATATLVAKDGGEAAALASLLSAKLDTLRRELGETARDPRMPRAVSQAIESLGRIRIAADGSRVRVTGVALQGSGMESFGLLSAVAVPAYLRYVDRARDSTVELELRRAELAVTEYAVTHGAPPMNDRVKGACEVPDCNAECVPRRWQILRGGSVEPEAEEWRCSTPGPDCSPDTIWGQLDFRPRGRLRHQFCYSVVPSGDGWTAELVAFPSPRAPEQDPIRRKIDSAAP